MALTTEEWNKYVEIKDIFRTMEEQSLEDCKIMVKEDYDNIGLVKNQTEDLVLWAMDYYINQYNESYKHDVDEVYFIYDSLEEYAKTDKVNKKLLSHYPRGLKLIPKEKQTEELCLLAVSIEDRAYLDILIDKTDSLNWKCLKANSSIIQHIKNPTEDMILYAVKDYYANIRYINKNLITEKIADTTINNFVSGDKVKNIVFVWHCIKRIPDKYITRDRVLILFSKDYRNVFGLNEKLQKENEDLCLKGLEKDGLLLKHLENPTREMYITALKQNGLAIEYIPFKKRDEELCIIAINQNYKAFKYNSMPESQKIYDTLTSKNPNSIKDVPSPYRTKELIDKVMMKNSTVIKHLYKNEITDEYCERAINRKGELIKDIIYKGYESERMVEFVFLSLYKDSKLFDYIKNNLNDSTAIYILKKFEEFTKIKSKFNDEKYKDTISRWENMYNAYKLLNS